MWPGFNVGTGKHGRRACRDHHKPGASPFGLPQSGALPNPFGFTGELHHNDLVYLRARWYDPASGTLLGRDPFAGYERMPYSLHPYQYGYSAPTMYDVPE